LFFAEKRFQQNQVLMLLVVNPVRSEMSFTSVVVGRSLRMYAWFRSFNCSVDFLTRVLLTIGKLVQGVLVADSVGLLASLALLNPEVDGR
jgi:hypothetical protein